MTPRAWPSSTAASSRSSRPRAGCRTSATRSTTGCAANIGIGHTRWATHGEPNEINAHPHLDAGGHIAVVHNGIIENAEQLRDQLTAAGVRLVSDTDTEALAHLIAAEIDDGEPGTSLEDAVRRALTPGRGHLRPAGHGRPPPG